MPLQATSGAASYDAFGGGVAAVPKYIEDYFSTYLYSGNNTARSITNGVDLSTKGGLTWIKERTNASGHSLFDTARGAGFQLSSNSTAQQYNNGVQTLTSFNTDGFSLGTDTDGYGVNRSGNTYASWSIAKAPKFFDVVTYTGDGEGFRSIPHNLGAVPGCFIIKSTTRAEGWWVYHRSAGENGSYQKALSLNSTAAAANLNNIANTSQQTSTNFVLGDSNIATVNNAGDTYVAYLFAHDAGGFGLTGTDNVISCGSFTTDGSGNASVNLGYEPQWVLIKQTDGVDSWYLNDNMRGMAVSGNQPNLSPNSSAAESAGGYNTYTNATGFTASVGIASKNYIYIAIRRGPMKVPTDGTKVFAPTLNAGNSSFKSVTTGFPPDMVFGFNRTYGGAPPFIDKLRGVNKFLVSSATTAEQTDSTIITSFNNDGLSLGQDTNGNGFNNSGRNFVFYPTRRAPGFFDEVCYTGTGSATTVTHNLTAVPELMIVKNRGVGTNWAVYSSALGATQTLFLNTTATPSTITSVWNDTAPTASVFTVGSAAATNTSANTYVNYLFATCPGVSKVGSYTGTGAAQTIDCGFTGGARFVLIKCTNAAGDWYVWDSARGMVFGTDPYLRLNSTAAEFSNLPTGTYTQVTSETGGFGLSAAETNVNINSYSYIFLAIA